MSAATSGEGEPSTGTPPAPRAQARVASLVATGALTPTPPTHRIVVHYVWRRQERNVSSALRDGELPVYVNGRLREAPPGSGPALAALRADDVLVLGAIGPPTWTVPWSPIGFVLTARVRDVKQSGEVPVVRFDSPLTFCDVGAEHLPAAVLTALRLSAEARPRLSVCHATLADEMLPSAAE
jgi:hypothetical protein